MLEITVYSALNSLEFMSVFFSVLEMRDVKFSLERTCDFLTLLLIALLHLVALQAQPFLVMRILQSALHAINKNSRELQSSRFNISSLC